MFIYEMFDARVRVCVCATKTHNRPYRAVCLAADPCERRKKRRVIIFFFYPRGPRPSSRRRARPPRKRSPRAQFIQFIRDNRLAQKDIAVARRAARRLRVAAAHRGSGHETFTRGGRFFFMPQNSLFIYFFFFLMHTQRARENRRGDTDLFFFPNGPKRIGSILDNF